jgi:hypothetical protein
VEDALDVQVGGVYYDPVDACAEVALLPSAVGALKSGTGSPVVAQDGVVVLSGRGVLGALGVGGGHLHRQHLELAAQGFVALTEHVLGDGVAQVEVEEACALPFDAGEAPAQVGSSVVRSTCWACCASFVVRSAAFSSSSLLHTRTILAQTLSSRDAAVRTGRRQRGPSMRRSRPRQRYTGVPRWWWPWSLRPQPPQTRRPRSTKTRRPGCPTSTMLLRRSWTWARS